MMKGYANVVHLAYVILMSLLSFDMSDCTLAAMDEINNNNNNNNNLTVLSHLLHHTMTNAKLKLFGVKQ
jgi:hypothetical protein